MIANNGTKSAPGLLEEGRQEGERWDWTKLCNGQGGDPRYARGITAAFAQQPSPAKPAPIDDLVFKKLMRTIPLSLLQGRTLIAAGGKPGGSFCIDRQ